MQDWINNLFQVINNVTNYFQNRPNDLLIINIPAGEGWEKLCPFLNLPIPELPFPHKNKLLGNKNK